MLCSFTVVSVSILVLLRVLVPLPVHARPPQPPTLPPTPRSCPPVIQPPLLRSPSPRRMYITLPSAPGGSACSTCATRATSDRLASSALPTPSNWPRWQLTRGRTFVAKEHPAGTACGVMAGQVGDRVCRRSGGRGQRWAFVRSCERLHRAGADAYNYTERSTNLLTKNMNHNPPQQGTHSEHSVLFVCQARLSLGFSCVGREGMLGQSGLPLTTGTKILKLHTDDGSLAHLNASSRSL